MYKKTFDDLSTAPSHPGEVLREDVLPHIEMTRGDLARHLGVPADVLSELVDERRPVTLDLARRLGDAFGQGARYWLGLQAQYDHWLASQPVESGVRPLQWRRRERGLRRTPVAA